MVKRIRAVRILFAAALAVAHALCVLVLLAAPTPALAQAGLLLYVPQAGASDSIAAYRLAADGTVTLVQTIPGGFNDPVNVAVRGDQAFAYVTFNASDRVGVIDTRTQTIVQDMATGAVPRGVAISPDGTRVYVANNGLLPATTVSKFGADPITGQLTALGTITTGTRPRALAFSPDGTKLYVANQTSNNVVVVDVATDAILATIANGGQNLDIAVNPAGTRAYVGSTTGLYVLDLTTNTLVTQVDAAAGTLSAVRVSPNGARIFATNTNINRIRVYDAATNTLVNSVNVTGSSPLGLALTPSGGHLYLTNNASNILEAYSVNDTALSILQNPVTGATPGHLGACANGNQLLATGRTFVANTAEALECTNNAPTFTGGTLRIGDAGLSTALNFTLGAGGGTIDTNANNLLLTGIFTGTSPLTKSGAGTLTLSGANNYSGATIVLAGTLAAGAANRFSASSAMSVAAGAIVDLSNFSQAIGSLSGTGMVTLGAGTLTAGGDNTNTTFSGVISGSGGLVKTGGGSMVLTGTNTYTGPTTVNAGFLNVAGALGPGAVTVAGGAVLVGNGSIAGPVTVDGSLSPGAGAPGQLSTGNLTLNATGAFSTELNGTAAGGTYDRVIVTGTVSLAGSLSPTLGFVPAAGQVFTIIENDGVDPVGGAFAGLPQGSTFTVGGTLMRISYAGGTGNDVTLTVVVVPTLSTVASAGVAFGGAVTDIATIAAGNAPTGTVTFRLYGPNDATCAGAPLFTDTKAVSGNGAYVSASFTPTAVGVYRWIASYSGDATNAPVSGACNDANESVTVSQAAQALTFAAQSPASRTFAPGATFAISPVATSALPNSGNAIVYSSLTTGVCTVAGTTVTMVAVGTCTIAANQAGNANYGAATQVTQNVAIGVAAQTLTFPAQSPASRPLVPGGTFAISPLATSAAPNSGNAVVYSSLTAGVCTVAGTTVTMVAVGTCTIAANQAGDANYAAATQVTQGVTITAAVVTTYTGPSATGSGTITASFTGGGSTCTFAVSQFIPVAGHPNSPPASVTPPAAFPHGLFDFTLTGCTPGAPVTMTVTYPAPLVPTPLYWKYGPTPTDAAPHWYVLPATFAGNVATFTITDGQLGDDDLAPNGTIVDQGGPGVPAVGSGAIQTPTLSEWAMLLLALLLLVTGLRGRVMARAVPRN